MIFVVLAIGIRVSAARLHSTRPDSSVRIAALAETADRSFVCTAAVMTAVSAGSMSAPDAIIGSTINAHSQRQSSTIPHRFITHHSPAHSFYCIVCR
jgi:hypothetical protein